MIRKALCLMAIVVVSHLLIAQPGNDECYLAMPIVIPQSGQICINASNMNATPDGIAPNICNQPTGGNEVWFTYITTGANNLIAVSPSGGSPAQTVAITIPTGGCAGNVPLACDVAPSVNGTAIVNQSFPIGTQVWFEVTALTSDGDFTICITSADNPPTYAPNVGDSCVNAIQLCNKQTFTTLGAPGFANSGSFLTCYGFGALNDIYFKFDVGKTGTLEWLATPSGAINLDWEVLDISAGCPGNSIACNYTYVPPGGQTTGMQDTSATPCGNSGHICNSVVVTAGNTYLIHINNTSFLPGVGFTISFGGTFEMAPFPKYTLSSITGCDSLTIAVYDSSIGATNYNWVFGNGNTFNGANPPPQQYIAPGSYLTSLVVTDVGTGCSHVASAPITVNEKPTAFFIMSDTLICNTQSSSAIYLGSGTANGVYNWNFSGANIQSGSGAGPYTLDWAVPGVKNISLYVVENGCVSDTVTKTVTVIAPPVAAFNLPASACVGDTLTIAYTGTVVPGSLYAWTTGNATTVGGNGADTIVVYWPTSQSDSISLQVDAGGCLSNVLFHTITIYDVPTASFSAIDSACSGATVAVTYTGTGTPSAIYSWNFSSGLAIPGGTVQGPHNVVWSTAGIHLLSLTVTENGCQSSIANDTINILAAPDAQFTVTTDTLCSNDSTTITYTGTTPQAVFTWNFAGANIISGSGNGPYIIDWPAPGTYTISLVLDNGICTDTVKHTLYKGTTPVAIAGSDGTYCSGDSLQIGAPPAPFTNYLWTPSAGLTTATTANPYVVSLNNTTLPTVANYLLTAYNTLCKATDTVAVTINANQQAAISLAGNAYNQCIDNNSYNFSINAPLIVGATINWTFGAAASPNSDTVATVNNVTYNAVGTYLVTLTTTANGCPVNTDTVTVTIQDVPKVNFGADSLLGCPPLTVYFHDSSFTVPGSIYNWSFGNGDSSNVVNPVYTYNTSGVFSVTLTVTSPNGCAAQSSATNLVNVTQAPIATLSAEPTNTTILQPNIQFLNASPNADSCFIDFGDGHTYSGCDNLVHTYNDTGTYYVTLITYSAGGCIDSTIIKIEVKPFFTLFIPNAFTPNNDISNEVLQVYGEGINEFSISIFNRLGQEVFASTNKDFAWRGVDKNGDNLPQGNYVYVIYVQDIIGKRHYKQGIVSLLR